MSKYKLRMFSYRTKSFLKNFFGAEGKRGSRIFSIFAILVMVLLVASISIYGLNLKGKAENQTQISAVTIVNYDGVFIHTKAARIVSGVSDYSATVKSGDTIRFTLTVSNASTNSTATDVKFTLPAGFSFVSMVTTPAGLPAKVGPDANGVIMWPGYSAPVGESVIEFDTKAP